MTNKRFEVTFNDTDYHLRDNENDEEIRLFDEKVCYDYISDLLNALHEENKQLGQFYDIEEKLNSALSEENEELHEENEELIDETQRMIKEHYELVDKCLDLRTEKDEYKKKVTETLQKHYDKRIGNDRLLEELAEELGVELK